jgi:hypothetical protein
MNMCVHESCIYISSTPHTTTLHHTTPHYAGFTFSGYTVYTVPHGDAEDTDDWMVVDDVLVEVGLCIV